MEEFEQPNYIAGIFNEGLSPISPSGLVMNVLSQDRVIWGGWRLLLLTLKNVSTFRLIQVLLTAQAFKKRVTEVYLP